MKIRLGFVSNSSSSSFTIATKRELSRDELKGLVEKALKIPQDSPLYFLGSEMTAILANAREVEIKEVAKDYHQSVGEFLSGDNFVGRATRKGFTHFYCGQVADDESPLEALLCNIDINFENDEVIVEHEGGY